MSHSRSVLAGGMSRTNCRAWSARAVCPWLLSDSLVASHRRSSSRRVSRTRSLAGSPIWSASRSAAATASTRSRMWVDARRRIGFNADATQVAREFLSPLTQGSLADIQALTLLADCLDDRVDVGMRLVGMERQGMAVLERQLPATEPLRRKEYLVRRRSGGHG